jgi:Tfp pilus assembly protein FimT
LDDASDQSLPKHTKANALTRNVRGISRIGPFFALMVDSLRLSGSILMSTIQTGNRGFTLLQTVSALAIAMIVLGIVLPSVMNGLQNYRLAASAQDIAGQIQSARYRALQNNSVCSFILTSTDGHFGIDADSNGDLTSGTQDVVISLNNRVSFTTLTTPPITGATSVSTGSKSGVGFTPRGTLTTINSSSGQPDFTTAFPASGVVVYLSNPGNEFAAITVSPAGRVRTWTSGNGVTWR